MDKATFRNMQEVFKHASAFVESKKKARLQARRKTTDSPRSASSFLQTSTTESPSAAPATIDGVANVRSHFKGLNITSMPDSPRPANFFVHRQSDDRDFRSSDHYAGEHHSRGTVTGEHEDKNSKSPSANPLYKTRLCERFETEGYCPYEGKCTFAHGTKELRERTAAEQEDDKPSGRADMGENNLFKTRLCERFMKGNFCQYGPKCNFGKISDRQTDRQTVEYLV
jgi:hypothetical protein